ncbi:antibiotic biosynthesis monooxygenase [Pseudomonas sp. 148P]|uniref:Antibiotic biosynthesis monooxygenase n=1 Tax=Pseudomonas ulcerans TaxID=3115852 RepID=A0ABU7HU79_9PSED|nr:MULTISPECIES: antibiotic biosynthesis monooxygenase [unclassified Pseudomonas]MEE1923913.1 antibiotic biosynthesis monooxygenase [Pseudomonas sp. 147P]MEE1935090.1 antibiotic biosynthesis monooxygenase [Pseudomonas sp. 148P]
MHNPVLELALFTVKPEYVAQMPQLRDGLREALKAFPGLIEYRGYSPLNDQRTFVDLALWENLESAAAVARAFSEGDPRFGPYAAAIEHLTFMEHFAPERSD